MRRKNAFLVALLLAGLVLSMTPVVRATAAPVPGVDYASLVERNQASVVFVIAKKASAAASDKDAKPDATGSGSGFVYDASNGLVLTNAHVVGDAKEVTLVFSDKRRAKAKVVGRDERTDVAVLKTEAKGLKAVQVGDLSKLRVGDPVMAVGAPFGLEMTVTAGIVSAKNRTLGGQFVPFIQTDAAVNPGNSGGPLFSRDGAVVGINSQIYTKSGTFAGLSFAIPIDIAMKVADSLVREGRVTRSRLGLGIQSVSEELVEAFGLEREQGALVTSVEPGGPADKAGLREGDVVLAADGRKVDESLDLPRYITGLKPGAAVKLDIWRAGKQLSLTAKVTALQQTDAGVLIEPEHEQRVGFAVRALSAQERESLEVPSGLLVEGIRPGSQAAKLGFKPGDVLLTVGGSRLESVQQLRAAFAPTDKPGKVAVLMMRPAGRAFIVLDRPERAEAGEDAEEAEEAPKQNPKGDKDDTAEKKDKSDKKR